MTPVRGVCLAGFFPEWDGPQPQRQRFNRSVSMIAKEVSDVQYIETRLK